MNRGIEIASDVADGPQSVIRDQVRNGVAVRMAVLGGDVMRRHARMTRGNRRHASSSRTRASSQQTASTATSSCCAWKRRNAPPARSPAASRT